MKISKTVTVRVIIRTIVKTRTTTLCSREWRNYPKSYYYFLPPRFFTLLFDFVVAIIYMLITR